MIQQSRFGLTSVVTLDASRKDELDERGRRVYIDDEKQVLVGRAGGLNDGSLFMGKMQEVTGHDNYLGELAAQLDVLKLLPEGGRVMIVFDATSPVYALRRFALRVARSRQKIYAGSWLECFLSLIRRQQVVIFRWQTSHVGSPLNEWADRLADLATLSVVVDVPRCPVTFGAFFWSGAKRGVQAWARERGKRVVHDWLASFASETPMRDAKNEIRLPPLPGRAAPWADRVLSARAHAGDPRLRRELGERCTECDVACPFGCKDAMGVAAPFTWWHVQFCCRCPEAVAARGAWEAEMKVSAGALNGGEFGGVHSQLRVVRAMQERGQAWRSGEAFPEFDEVEVRAARRLLGGAVDLGERGCNAKAAKKAAWRIVVTGLEVHVVAESASKGFTKKVRAAVQGRNKLARHVAAWRRLVLIGGPSRASALARMSTAREAVTRFGSNCAVVVGLGSPFQDAVALAVTALVPVAVAGTQSSSPVTDWWCKTWLLRWALRVAEVHKRRRALLAVMRCALRFWRARARGASLFLLRWGQPTRACVQVSGTSRCVLPPASGEDPSCARRARAAAARGRPRSRFGAFAPPSPRFQSTRSC